MDFLKCIRTLWTPCVVAFVTSLNHTKKQQRIGCLHVLWFAFHFAIIAIRSFYYKISYTLFCYFDAML